MHRRRASARPRSTLRCNEALRIHAARLKHPRRTCVFSTAFVNTRRKRERIEESTRVVRVRAHSRRISFARLAIKSSPGASRASSLSRPLSVIFSLLSPPPLLILSPRPLLASAPCALRRLRPTTRTAAPPCVIQGHRLVQRAYARTIIASGSARRCTAAPNETPNKKLNRDAIAVDGETIALA
jgi:hypothetical protein